MIDTILAIALLLGTLTVSQGPQGPAGPVPMPPGHALNSAQ
ncbi:MAG TPA: hypothetical protein VGK24_18640 [Candidatus Angelobacter sp.]